MLVVISAPVDVISRLPSSSLLMPPYLLNADVAVAINVVVIIITVIITA